MRVEVTSEVIESLRLEARRAGGREACGILLGRGNRVDRLAPCRNVHPDPESHFEIDPQALVNAHREARQGGPEVMGYYHSHPSGSAHPSPADRARALGDGRLWAIVANGRICWWRDGSGGFVPVEPSEAGGT